MIADLGKGGPFGGQVLVVGFRVTGQAVAGYLRSREMGVLAVDDAPTEAVVARAAALGIDLVVRPDEQQLSGLLGACRTVVVSPGIPVSHAIYRLAASAGVPVYSELELGWQRLLARAEAGTVASLVAVTGTNGKTTVTSLTAAMLVESGLTSVAAGNIGLPFIDAAGLDADVLVAEVSSYQLQFTQHFHPTVSCWLNLTEDHLDWHPTMAHYRAAKARVWANQGPGDVAVVNADDPAVMAAVNDPDHALPSGVRPVTFSIGSRADFHVARRSPGDDLLMGPQGLALVGTAELPRALPLDLANSLAAAATALAAGATPEGCRAALRQFTGLPHRIELVAQGAGVRWYDDSKSTTPASVLAAVAGFDSVVLIAGGRNKGLDLSILGRAGPKVHTVVAIGDAAEEIERAFSGTVPVIRAETMAEAVAAAGGAAVAGDAVLLSPGCASFDWYRSYAERGDEFVALVNARVGNEESRL